LIFRPLYLCIRITPTAVAAPSGSTVNPKTNHWVLYLAISQAESIQLDPSPDGQNKLIIIVTRKQRLVSENVKVIQLSPVEDLTVGNVLEYLITSKHTQFQFSNGGQGCRYWVYSVIALFHLAGYVVEDSQVVE
jgi:hypothetical protein